VTATFLSKSVSDATSPGELIDSLIEAVVLPTNALDRSAVICDVLNELCNAVAWLHGSATLPPNDSVCQELAGLRQLQVAAKDHQLRMRALGADALGRGANHELA
jgi:hypothetical protein